MQSVSCFWLFCTVIDNFGDVGVSWRLARELRVRTGARVCLWLDDAAALRTIVPDTPELPCTHQGIELRLWQEGQWADLDAAPLPDAVVETFACALPERVLKIIGERRAHWLNWEYLSAEAWAVRTHAMQSLQSNGAAKYFWQMGFCPESGGLLREQDYAARRAAFLDDEQAQAALRKDLCLPPKAEGVRECFAFGYADGVWADWFGSLRETGQPLTLWLAGGQIIDSLRGGGCIGAHDLQQAGDFVQCGSLRLQRIAFVPQSRFDEILWLADMLWVRGEDSFIRAQYAAKPMFWHIYPQAELAHLDKLDAFWQTVDAHAPLLPELHAAHRALSDELNGGAKLDAGARTAHWQTLFAAFPQWQAQTAQWQAHLFAQSDSVSRLQDFLAARHQE